MSWWQAIILGLVQGITEFLPVSSSGHLVIFKDLLGVEASSDLLFEVTVHAATVLATVLIFRKQIVDLFKGLFKFKYNDQTDYILKIGVSLIPIFVVGVFFKDVIEQMFSSLYVVGICLIITSFLLYFSDKATGKQSASTQKNGISYIQAFVIGLGQAFAALPGLSRSGTTISTGLLVGVKREVIAQFSFLMVIIPILGEAFLNVVGGDFASSSVGVLPLVLGFISAFISGLLACKGMIALVKKAKLKWFALYCAIVGVAVLIVKLLM